VALDTFLIVIAFVLGALVGSFLNVVLWRVPRGESIVSPGSHCPSCGTFLRPVELVPIFSWVVLRGHCRTCGVSISARYPLVELGCGIGFALVAWSLVSL
jgi:prepilin signal peptidase PulO-like enzyme (type II secretory pathway)